jgi:hypothetical protein
MSEEVKIKATDPIPINGMTPDMPWMAQEDSDLARAMRNNPDLLTKCHPTMFKDLRTPAARQVFAWGKGRDEGFLHDSQESQEPTPEP